MVPYPKACLLPGLSVPLRFSNVVIHYIRDESSLMSVFLIFGKLIMFTLSLTIDISKEDD